MRRRTGTSTVRPSWTDRAGALSGAAYVVLVLVGNQIATGGAQDTHPTGRQDLATFAATCAARANDWWPCARRSADGSGGTCTTGSGPLWPASPSG